MANPPRLWLDIEYQFEVLSAPEGDDGEYRVAIDSERLHYVATYSKRPFALDRLEDRSGWSLPIIRLPGAPKAPCLSGVVAAFITDFPAPPDAAVPGKQPLRIQGMMGSVEIAPTAEGARWTYGTILSVVTFTWARGAPWWSTVEKHVPPEFGAPEMEPKAFSGRLVSFTRR